MNRPSDSAPTGANAQIPAALVRAGRLEQAGKTQQAVQLYRKIAAQPRLTLPHCRQIIAGLVRCGETSLAGQINRRLVEIRAAKLPDTIEAALERVWEDIDADALDQAVVDWAWSNRDPEFKGNREEFERRAKWGIRAERVLLDWLECRPDDDSAKSLFIDGDASAQQYSAIGAHCRAAAHVGPIFAGPLLYELYDIDVKYIGSFPALPGSVLSRRLISTSTNDKQSVRRMAEDVVRDGSVLVMAADGNSGGPPLEDASEEELALRISPLIPRLVHRHGVTSSYGMAQWVDCKKIQLSVTALPQPEDGESEEGFIARWRQAYRDHALAQTKAAPENLRLHRGLWRDIAPAKA
ncbi:hypothetical protein [Sphingomicrobium arenosum]|uniref:hypothetical protein n=1 Tax=Sphingomicrobium arenosum TaxID=2233861 RepID=UPI00223FA813|nr:hypothetical protein [Sphingomicrobium arenosum]